jgi:hypothetical protein
VPVQSRQDRADCTPPAILVSACALSPVVASVALAAVAIGADRRPRLNSCPCRDCKPLQVIANFSNHRHLCTSNGALVGRWPCCPDRRGTGDGASVRRLSKAMKEARSELSNNFGNYVASYPAAAAQQLEEDPPCGAKIIFRKITVPLTRQPRRGAPGQAEFEKRPAFPAAVLEDSSTIVIPRCCPPPHPCDRRRQGHSRYSSTSVAAETPTPRRIKSSSLPTSATCWSN